MSVWDDWKSKGNFISGPLASTTAQCYRSHPALKLSKGLLYGGSASHPAFRKADVYVSLQEGSLSGLATDPWETEVSVTEVVYHITDMTAPSNTARFKAMVTWVCNQLQAGKHVHIGCFGGHGRTGTVITAIVAELCQEKNAIQWVRKHYCHKAVESQSQVDFLVKHYGVTKEKPTKHFGYAMTSKKSSKTPAFNTFSGFAPELEKAVTSSTSVTPKGSVKAYAPVTSSRSIWKKVKRLI